MNEQFASARFFWWGVSKRFYLMLGPLLLDPFDLFSGLFGTEIDAPPWLLWVLFGIGFTLAASLAYHELYEGKLAADRQADSFRRQIDELRSRQTKSGEVGPRLVLGEPTPVEGQILDRTHLVPDPKFSSGVAAPPKIRVEFERVKVLVWRVPVENEGDDSPATYVELTSIDPQIGQGKWPCPLHLAGDNPDDHAPESYRRSRGFRLPKGGKVPVDVVAMTNEPPFRCFIFAVESSDALLEVTLGSTQTFMLTAFGGPEPVRHNYWVRLMGGDPPQMIVARA